MTVLVSLVLLSACSGEQEEAVSASVAFVDPVEGDRIEAGTRSVSVLVDGFALASPAKHNEGEPTGYVSVTLDGEEVLQTGSTVFDVTFAEVGAVTLGAELFYADGDALEPPVSAEIALEIVPVAVE
jgi:hypothetical protein